MPYISQITLPSGSTYDLRDSEARELIEDLQEFTSSGIHFRGTTTTELNDGANTNPILLDGEEYTAVTGDMVIYGTAGINQEAPREFIYNGTKWTELGSTGALKALAFKDSASVSYTPAGTVSIPNFTGTAGKATTTYTPTGSVSTPSFTGTASTATASYKPEGTVSTPSFSGTAATLVVKSATGDSTYTPAGSVAAPSFTGTTATIVINGGSGTSTYTPGGTVSTPSITVKTAGSTTTVNSITNIGTLPSWSGEVADELLTISFNQGTLPTKGANTTVKTGDATYQSSQPSFSGTGTRLTGSYTPSGTNSAPAFTGTGVRLESQYTPQGTVSRPTFSGTTATISSSYTPSGKISQPSFTGAQATIESDYIPSGSVSRPIFSGDSATITVS